MDSSLTAELGTLSSRYESNGDPGAVSTGTGDRGGVSYGMYQFATAARTPERFVAFLDSEYPEFHKALAQLAPGTPAFSAAWKQLACNDRDGFVQAQHDFILAEYYAPAVAAISQQIPGFDVADRSKVVNDVLWSTAVQHGTGGAIRIFAMAAGDNPDVSDEELVRRVYSERGRTDSSGKLVHFGGCSPAVQKGVARRFASELSDALAELAQEQAA
jgi:hypothetical protein